ncbi:hypothetical protein Hanom_Chr09g00806981 [Helianthus anomalus]
MFYYVFGDLVVIGYKKTDTSYFIKVPLHDYTSCIWRCKRVGTRKVIHLEIDIYLAYWYFLF